MSLKYSAVRRARRERCSCLVVLSAVLAVGSPLGCSIYDASLLTGSAAISADDGGNGGARAGSGGTNASAAGSDVLDAGGALASMAGGSGVAAAGGTSSTGAAGSSSAGGASGQGGAGAGGASGQAGASSGGAGSQAGAASSGGASSQAGASSGGVAGSGGAPIELARGKAVTASSAQVGNGPAKGNDNDTGSRWCAVNSTFPQWWRVDLGAVHALKQVAIQFEHPERKYNYVIETSQDDAVYTQEATVNGTGAVQTVDLPANVSARYLRITITGGTPGVDANGTMYPTWASFYELSLFGF